MKQLSVLFSAVLLFIATSISAQKIAHIDARGVLEQMPEYKKAVADLNSYKTTKETDIKKQYDDFDTEVNKYKADQPKLTEAQRSAKETELNKKMQSLQSLEQVAQEDLAKKQQDLLKPVMDKLNNTITKVAKANGWDYVADVSMFIYSGGGIDATPLVKKDLGL
ncbi:OmpH family outer membrane protein [Weeksellaceae bacterium A-14]|uniref:OmpH family outer membrane protein n=1 Tax=Daejeonia sp. YH14 TaxID=3439042 RepID=UPI0031E4AD1C